MAEDRYPNNGAEATAPAVDFEVITKSDSVDYPGGIGREIHVGGAGIVQVVRMDGEVVPFTVPAGGSIRGRSIRVNSTSTTATLMVVYF